jgi:phosphatidylserine/phosphatidylglycerophosphate/cardiolipin synthase-like enzyme
MLKPDGMGFLCCIVVVLAFFWGCQQKEPLEPPYDDPVVAMVANRDYTPFLLSCIGEADEQVHVIMYLMKCYPSDTMNGVSQLQRALIAANNRGVDVRVILEQSDYNSSLNATNESSYVYLDSMGIEVRFDPLQVTTHAKLVIVDSRIAVVGSSNWSRAALEENNEMNVRIQDTAAVSAMESYFQDLWSLCDIRSRGRRN